MDWKLLSATFVTIFLAEIGDKTQFAAFAISAQSKSTISVLVGAVLALALAAVIGVLLGSMLGKFVDPVKMKYISGSLFILMGIWILVKAP